ncbi:phosphatase PAP2 family protein [Spiroplasma endosymbiont of Aspidapion aeneum]|uniref:phosphatase PAP2 family protein n=1 Tax=Spiroplasma endosymbiont of Aspidapion aeneum TaxID=3066276 RepID=UPI00313EABB9
MKKLKNLSKNIFKTNEKNVYIKIPFIVIFFIGLIGFITTSFFDLDNKWVAYGWDLQKSHFIKSFCYFYFNIGTNQLTVLLPICAIVLFESFMAKIKRQKHWSVYGFYIFLAIFWIVYNWYIIYSTYNADDGWGFGICVSVLLDGKSALYGIIAITVINTIIFVAVAYLIHFKIAKFPTFIEDKYWHRSLFLIIYVLIMYFFIIIIKQSTGRPEYIFTNFEDIVGKITWGDVDKLTGRRKAIDIDLTPAIRKINGITDADMPKLKANILREINNNNWAPSNYFQWWQINGDWVSNLKHWAIFNWFTDSSTKNMPTGWYVINFPSGHMNATFTTFGYGYIFLYENKNIKKKWKISFMILWLVHLFGMLLTLTISTLHYPTDCFFTMTLCPLIIYPSLKATDFCVKLALKIVDHKKNKVVLKIEK